MAMNDLLVAACAGDHDAMIQLKMRADKLDDDNNTILHLATIHASAEQVDFILREFTHKTLLARQNSQDETALHLAARLRKISVVKLLLAAADFIDDDDDPSSSVSFGNAFVRLADERKNTALHVAVNLGDTAIAELLIEADPSDGHIQIQNREGETALYLAAKLGRTDIVRKICTTCPPPISLDGPDGSTALHAAIMSPSENKKNLVRILIEAAKRSSDSAQSFEALFNKTNSKGETALHLAVLGNESDVVQVILMEDPAYQSENASKASDLKLLAYKAAEEGYTSMVKLLFEAYQARNTLANKDLMAFYTAVLLRDEDGVLQLLDDNASLVTYTDEIGWTPLHHAAYHKFDAVLETIVEAQEKVGYRPVYESGVLPPVLVAAREGHTSTVIQLLKLSPSSSYLYVTDNGENILHLAAAQNKKEMIKYILKHCPDKYSAIILKQQDMNGDTPLHVMIRNGCFVPELITHREVDGMAKNKHNMTPFDMLYVGEQIIGEQVEIKKALDDIHKSNCWPRSKRLRKVLEFVNRKNGKDLKLDFKMDLEKELLDFKENVKKKKIELEKGIKLKMFEDREKMRGEVEKHRKKTKSQIIVSALITTITFTVGFTMPGGYHQSGDLDEGLVLLSKERAFKAFMVSDALALVLSTSCLFIYFLASMYEDTPQVAKLNTISTRFNIASIMAMMLTFITGTFVVLSHSQGLAVTISVICCFFFIFVFGLLIKLKHDRRLERLKYEYMFRSAC